MAEFVENVFKGFLVQADVLEAWRYLVRTDQIQQADELLKKINVPRTFDTPHPWLNESLTAYYEYLRDCLAPLLKNQSSDIKEAELLELVARETLTKKLQEILAPNEEDLVELTEIFQNRVAQIGWYSKVSKSGRYLSPFVWKNETVEDYQVAMPHSTEKVRVHFMTEFLAKGWLDFLSNSTISVGGWVQDQEIYCLKEVYQDVLTQPKFQISLLKHETQHQIDAYYHDLTPVHLEYRAKLVELFYYSDISFLDFLLKAQSFEDPINIEAYAAAQLLADLKEYLLETGTVDPEEFLKMLTEKPLEWMFYRGQISQAALVLLDRDTKKILGQKGD
ncbi:hypothetical protein [Enterococcus timonensis]|uniref:hypothetical protein n=1 Tax=Enterococcus timonensis TaxID=1852364 RepID=UPI0008D968F2|nr:hypothetical protein [Enterococcus timonensis]